LIYTLRAYFVGIEDLIPWDGVQILKDDPGLDRVEIIAEISGREFRFAIEAPDDDDPAKGLGVMAVRGPEGGVIKGPIDPDTWARIALVVRGPPPKVDHVPSRL
jgi:hypothetical protein